MKGRGKNNKKRTFSAGPIVREEENRKTDNKMVKQNNFKFPISEELVTYHKNPKRFDYLEDEEGDNIANELEKLSVAQENLSQVVNDHSEGFTTFMTYIEEKVHNLNEEISTVKRMVAQVTNLMTGIANGTYGNQIRNNNEENNSLQEDNNRLRTFIQVGVDMSRQRNQRGKGKAKGKKEFRGKGKKKAAGKKKKK